MYIPDNIIRKKIENVYFIWGRGKTTIANKLHEKQGLNDLIEKCIAENILTEPEKRVSSEGVLLVVEK